MGPDKCGRWEERVQVAKQSESSEPARWVRVTLGNVTGDGCRAEAPVTRWSVPLGWNCPRCDPPGQWVPCLPQICLLSRPRFPYHHALSCRPARPTQHRLLHPRRRPGQHSPRLRIDLWVSVISAFLGFRSVLFLHRMGGLYVYQLSRSAELVSYYFAFSIPFSLPFYDHTWPKRFRANFGEAPEVRSVSPLRLSSLVGSSH